VTNSAEKWPPKPLRPLLNHFQTHQSLVSLATSPLRRHSSHLRTRPGHQDYPANTFLFFLLRCELTHSCSLQTLAQPQPLTTKIAKKLKFVCPPSACTSASLFSPFR